MKNTNEKKAKEVKKEKAVKVQGLKLFHALQANPNTTDRTLKNKAKFSNDNICLRAYETVKGVIEENKLTPENVFTFCEEYFNKKKVDCKGKDIKRPQRVLASLCCKATNASRSTSSFAQDLKHIGKRTNRATLKIAFPSFKDEILDTIFKGTFLPSRTK